MFSAPRRYQLFQRAKQLFDEYMAEHEVAPAQPTAAQRRAARGDAGLAEAEQAYRKSLELCEAAVSEHGQRSAPDWRGQRPGEGLFRQVDLNRRAAADPHNVAILYYQLGLLYDLQGRLEEAAPAFAQALQLLETLPQVNHTTLEATAKSHYFLGRIALEQGDGVSARPWLETAAGLFQSIGYPKWQGATEELLERCPSPSAPTAAPDDFRSPAPGMTTPAEPEAPSLPSPPASPYQNIGRAVVWFVTHSVGAAADRSMLEAVDRSFSAPEVCYTAFADLAFAPDLTPTLIGDPGLCAAVVVVEPAGLAHEGFRDTLRRLASRLASQDDFRLFLCLEDLSPEELTRQAAADPLLTYVLDRVQAAHMGSREQIRRQLAAYLEALGDIRNEAAWRRLKLNAAAWVRGVIPAVQAACVLIGAAAALMLPVWQPHPAPGRLAEYRDLLALLCGIGAAPLFLLGIYAYSRYGLMLVGMHRHGPGKVTAGLFSFLAMPLLAVPLRMQAPLPWLALGLTSGLLLDHARRRAYAALREAVVTRYQSSGDVGPGETAAARAVDAALVTPPGGALPAELEVAAASPYINPFTCPILPRDLPFVFISYGRRSAWGSDFARQLYERLRQLRIPCFYDRVSIREGDSWRRLLDRGVGQCSVLVALADPTYVCREWTAAELEAALHGRALTGSPDLVLVTQDDPELAAVLESGQANPVFQSVLEHAAVAPKSGTHLRIPYNRDTTLTQLAHLLSPTEYQGAALLPRELGWAAQAFWAPVRPLVTLLVGLPAMLFGHLAFVLVALHLLHRFNWMAFCAARGLTAPVFLLAAAMLGYAARMGLAERYELRRHRRVRGTFAGHRDAAIGFLILLSFWVRGLAPLLLGWGIMAACIGWIEATEMCRRFSRGDSGFFRGAEGWFVEAPEKP